MLVRYSRSFKKMFHKLPAQMRKKFEERLFVFMENPYHALLNNHPLHGEWAGCRSINITGDLRVVFEEMTDGSIEFIAIGNHSELYS